MYQIYVLSIVTTILAGLTLAYQRIETRLGLDRIFNPELFTRGGFRLGVGLVTFVVGFLKLLSVSPGDVAVVGDLVPALSGLVMGFALSFQYYRERTEVESSTVQSLDKIFGAYSGTIGVIGALSGVVHFFLHRVLFL
jgi:hypothetical protein